MGQLGLYKVWVFASRELRRKSKSKLGKWKLVLAMQTCRKPKDLLLLQCVACSDTSSTCHHRKSCKTLPDCLTSCDHTVQTCIDGIECIWVHPYIDSLSVHIYMVSHSSADVRQILQRARTQLGAVSAAVTASGRRFGPDHYTRARHKMVP